MVVPIPHSPDAECPEAAMCADMVHPCGILDALKANARLATVVRDLLESKKEKHTR